MTWRPDNLLLFPPLEIQRVRAAADSFHGGGDGWERGDLERVVG